MNDIKEQLKAQIIKQLCLEELTPSDIANDTPLFEDEGIGLDSIDALEIIVLLEQNYGIKISDPSKGQEIFQSVNTLSDFIKENQSS